MEMKYIIALVLVLVTLLVFLVIVGKNNGIMFGLVDGLKSVFGLN